MSHEVASGANFWSLLTRIDEAICEAVRRAGCGRCGGRLDRSDYSRKPRGGALVAASEMDGDPHRLSLCCDRRGCRRRSTPPSVRFFGRRVYVGAVFLLAASFAVVRPIVDVVLEVLVPLRTIRRWLGWWQADLPQRPLFTLLRAHLAVPLDCARLPASFLERLGRLSDETIEKALRMFSPLTTGSVIEASRFSMVGA